MGRSQFQRRVHYIRAASYAWFGLVLLVIGSDGERQGLLLAGCAYSAAMPVLIAALHTRWPAMWPQQLENGATGFVAGWLALSLLPTVAACAALLTGSLAQFGWRASLPWLLLTGTGYGAGMWLTPLPSLAPAPLVDFLSLGFIVAFATLLSALAYDQAIRMRRSRQALALQAESLQRYHPPGVVRRIFESGTAGGDVASGSHTLRRRWLTVCFVDLVSFTQQTQRLAPEALAIVLGDFMAAVSERVARHGGSVDKFLGDGVLITFGDPDSAGPHADALRCTVMVAGLDRLMFDLHQRWQAQGLLITFAFRAAVASGFCSVGTFGSGLRLDYTVIGSPVNLCRRLQELAECGETLIAASTRALLGAHVAVTPLGLHRLKGFGDPESVYRLVPAPDAPPLRSEAVG
jgi:class 3 adenylate cyclase